MFSRLFGGGATAAPEADAQATGNDYDQAVLVYLDGEGDGEPDLPNVANLEAQLAEVIGRDRLGTFEGKRPNLQGVTLRMYGPDAKKLFAGIEEVLRGEPACEGARVVIRTGGPGAPEREVRI